MCLLVINSSKMAIYKHGDFLSDSAALSLLGDRVRQLRLRKNITQTQLAKDSGVAKSTIERFEKGASVQLTNLVRILRALGKLDELLRVIPDQDASPMKMLLSEKTVKYRASNKRKKGETKEDKNDWKWGDE